MTISEFSDIGLDHEFNQNALLDSLTEGVYFVDNNRRILYWNKAAEELTGYKAEEVIGSACADGILMHVDEKGNPLCENNCPLAAVMSDGITREAHVFLHHFAGHRVPVHVRGAAIYNRHNSIIGCVEVFSDDTERIQIVDLLRDLEQKALVDQLTGLANRHYIDNALNASLAKFKREKARFGILVIDIDHFKKFNDTYGHLVGDKVLAMVSKTLTNSCRPYDIPARWGGEEFVLICEREDRESLLSIAERIRVLVSQSSLTLDGKSLSVTISIGGCLVLNGDTPESLFSRADEQLYISKESGRNRVHIS